MLRQKVSKVPSPSPNWQARGFVGLRRPGAVYGKGERERERERELGRVPAGVRWSRARRESVGTLELPMQGVRESFFRISVPYLAERGDDDGDGEGGFGAPGLRGQGSEGSLMREGGEVRDVKDII